MSFLFNKRMKILILLFAILTPNLTYSKSSSEVVAKIGKDVVTSRKVLADTILEENWIKASSGKTLSVQSEEFNNELNRFLMERVVYLESKSFSLISVTESELLNTKKALLQKIKKSKVSNSWDELGITAEELAEMVKQKVYSQKFIDFKSKASYVPVTEAEAFNYFQNNKSKYEGKEYKSIKESIKKSLAKLQAEQRLQDWYDILKKKYDVVKTISYVSPE